MPNCSVLPHLKEGFRIFTSPYRRMWPLIILFGCTNTIIQFIQSKYALNHLLGMVVAAYVVTSIIMIEWIQSIILDRSPSLNPLKLFGRIEILKYFIADLVLVILSSILPMTILIINFLLVPKIMPTKSFEILLLLTGFVIFTSIMIYIRLSFLSLNVAINNKISVKQSWIRTKGKMLPLVALMFLSKIPLVLLFIISFLLAPADIILPLISDPMSSKAHYLKETVSMLLNAFPAGIKPILSLIIAFISGAVSFVPITALCSFFKEDLKPS